jgi:hypothetical protein
LAGENPGALKKEKNVVIKRYTKRFSTLGRMQKRHTMIYELEETAGGCVIRVGSIAEGTIRFESRRVSVSNTAAGQMLRYLYENAVPLENWKDVLEDVLPAAAERTGGGQETT